MKISFIIAAFGAVLLSGCEMAEITQPPVQYKATKSLNEKGVKDFTARTFALKDGNRKEISGVPCKMSAPGFHSSFVTPAVVATPDMGPRTPVGSLSCTYNGDKKLEIMRPVNETVAQIESSAASAGAGAGIIGVIVSGISASTQKSRRDATLDQYGYPDVSVVFK
ncbi:hypothetical protein [Primorskyibacter marinus]|uniref:hypothetical protein n=1 Tax=Primorskyibacter marinus TaxID=1977320 RepID=UPI001300A124|nr:hypothetical protein [Primorskyibacter marinus]